MPKRKSIFDGNESESPFDRIKRRRRRPGLGGALDRDQDKRPYSSRRKQDLGERLYRKKRRIFDDEGRR